MSRSPAYATAICLLLTCAAAAQTPAKTARIGMLCGVRCTGAGHIALGSELRQLGWTEGGNLMIERREAEGRYERLPDLAAELVRLRPDLIVASAMPLRRQSSSGRRRC